MKDLSKLVEVIKSYDLDHNDLYKTRGIDPAELVYNEDGVELWYCQDYYYMDIIGLTNEEFKELKRLMKGE